MSSEDTPKTIMLIDDEVIDQKMYKRVIERSGAPVNVISFSYADEALEYLKRDDRKAIDIILLDVNMPRMNGFEFLEAATLEFGTRFAKAVIIMITTSLDPTDYERAQKFEVVKDFINKPLTVEHVKHFLKLIDQQEAF